MEKVENMNNGRPINEYTFNASNCYGSVRSYLDNNSYAQNFTKNDSIPLFSETTEYKTTKKDKKTEVNKTKED